MIDNDVFLDIKYISGCLSDGLSGGVACDKLGTGIRVELQLVDRLGIPDSESVFLGRNERMYHE